MSKFNVGDVVEFQGTAGEVRAVLTATEPVHYQVAIHCRPWPAPAELHVIAEANLDPYVGQGQTP